MAEAKAGEVRRALVVGGSGFLGRHLLARLAASGYETHGTGREGKEPPPGWTGGWHRLEVLERETIARALEASRPDAIFHAASHSEGSLEALLGVNVLGTERLLECVAEACPRARVVVIGSSAEYGLVHESELPIRETGPLRPVGPYGVSKAAQGLVAQSVALREGLSIVRARVFNLTGPGEPARMAGGRFAEELAAIRTGRKPAVLETGHLGARRDLLDVRDAAEAVVLLGERGEPGSVYNVCSGVAVEMREVVRRLVALGGVEVEVRERTPERAPSDVPVQQGSYQRLNDATGWKPTTPLERSLADLLADARQRLVAG